jgi:hypothetical protein
MVVVGGTIGLRAAEEPNEIRPCVEASHVVRKFAGPDRPHHSEQRLRVPSGPLVRVRKGFRPGVHELEQIKASTGIGNVNEDGLLGQIVMVKSKTIVMVKSKTIEPVNSWAIC